MRPLLNAVRMLLGTVLCPSFFRVHVAANSPSDLLWETETTGAVTGTAAFADGQVCCVDGRCVSSTRMHVGIP